MRTLRLTVMAVTAGYCLCANAQEGTTDSSLRASSVHSAVAFYQQALGRTAPLYIAPRYEEYAMLIQTGHPFFQQDAFVPGWVLFDDIKYENLLLKYDMALGQLVLNDTKALSRLALPYDRVNAFAIGDHYFQKLGKQDLHNLPKDGFYEVLFSKNGITLLKSESKKVEQEISNKSTVQRFVVSDINFYLGKEGTVNPMNRRSQALALFSDRRNQMREYMRRHEIDFSSDADLTALVTYYTSLK